MRGGGNLARAQEPPPVRSGSAQSICGQIRAAGYSPHDYIYRVHGYVERREDIRNYTHASVVVSGVQRVWVYLLPITFDSVGAISNVAIASTGGGGTITDLDGNPIPVYTAGDSSAGENGPGLRGYIFTPSGGGASEVYTDVVKLHRSARQTSWRYAPNWSGPDGARMSSIWRSVPLCVG